MSLFTNDGARPMGKGEQCPAGSVTDSELAAMLRGYKRSVASRYRSVVQEELATHLPPGKLLVSPKIDGELWFLVLDGAQAFFASPKGRVITGDVPVLKEALKALKRSEGRTIIAGELFAIKGKGSKGRPRVGDLANAMGGGEKAATDRIAFAAFDSLLGGDADASGSIPLYKDRLAMLGRLLHGGKRLQSIKTEEVTGGDKVEALFEQWVEGGKGEGLVIRTAENKIYKAKPTINIDAVIIGYTESSEDKNKVGSLLLAMMREDGSYQIIGKCGNMPDPQRFKFMKQLQKEHCDSNYRFANSKGALFRFTEPKTVIEVKLTDIQSETSSGDSIYRMVLEHKDGGWQAIREFPGASILHPVFVRIRDDKAVNPVDIRVSQVLERCLVENIDRKAERLVLPVSTVLRREVYTKTTKGEQAVRKLVVWATNKEALDPAYPAYVVHWTDYSAGRKTPLAREVRLAPDKALALEIAEGFVDKNIKKGWTQV
ncbi:MAG: ATP-dependent DNA ligase [Myxococcales bacterium]|nr:ATP-dependent DNA ligase [Myxococcales bacterium]